MNNNHLLNLESYNLHGFRNGVGMLNELSNTNNLIAAHELFLRPDECDKLNLINNNFNFYANSGMKEAVAKGIIRGRPYGGVAFLWHISLNKYIQVLHGDVSGRCLTIKVQSGTKSLVLFNIYFPCSESSSKYRAEISFYLGFMENILNKVYI